MYRLSINGLVGQISSSSQQANPSYIVVMPIRTSSMSARLHSSGFTLVELMIVVAVLAILLGIAAPSFQSMLDKRRLTGAAEQLYADLQYARSEAIRQNKIVTVYFSETTSPWCYGMDDDTASACNCNSAPSACTVGGVQKVVAGSDFRNVTLSSNFDSDNFVFDPRRGTASRQGTVLLQSTSAGAVNVIVSQLGRVKLCASTIENRAKTGYPLC